MYYLVTFDCFDRSAPQLKPIPYRLTTESPSIKILKSYKYMYMYCPCGGFGNNHVATVCDNSLVQANMAMSGSVILYWMTGLFFVVWLYLKIASCSETTFIWNLYRGKSYTGKSIGDFLDKYSVKGINIIGIQFCFSGRQIQVYSHTLHPNIRATILPINGSVNPILLTCKKAA